MLANVEQEKVTQGSTTERLNKIRAEVMRALDERDELEKKN
jgi:hypothetical protein